MTFEIDEILGPDDFWLGVGLADLLYTEVGGTGFLYAVGGAGSGVTAFSVEGEGKLVPLDVHTFGSPGTAGVASSLAAGVVDGASVLLIGGRAMDGDGALGLASNGATSGTVGVQGVNEPLVAPLQVETRGGRYLIGGSLDGGLIVLAETQGGTFAETAEILDTDQRQLDGISALEARDIGGASFIFAASATENAVTSLAVAENGTLAEIDRAGAVDGIGFDAPQAMASFSAGGHDYIALASPGSSSLSVLEVDEAGRLELADQVVDNLSTRFDAPTTLAAAEFGDWTFVATGGGDDGVSLFAVLPEGRLVHLESFEDTIDTTLSDVRAIEVFGSGGDLRLVVASESEPGLTILGYDLGPVGAVLVGTSETDTINGDADVNILDGGAGDDVLHGRGGPDIIFDGAGSDTLTGGAGRDLFVFAADDTPDQITDFEVGRDRMDLSAFELLYGWDQVALMPTATGAVLTYRNETVTITRSDLKPLTAQELTDSDILNVDRPIFLPADQVLVGTFEDDFLSGGDGNDLIEGLAGQDALSGDGGDDDIRGGGGFDVIDGGPGRDLLDGGGQADTIYGGADDDRIYGQDGRDTLSGDGGQDVILGGNGDDILRGGMGADDLSGGIGEDSLFGGDGDDVLRGEAGLDRLDGGSGRDSLYGGAQADSVDGGADADEIWGGDGADTLSGGTGEDRLFGESGDDRLFGDAGFDEIDGGTGQDEIWGGAQADTLRGGEDADTLHGEDGKDTLEGGSGADWISGGFGNDVARGGVGNDRIFGGSQEDRLFGDDGADVLFGEGGFDRLEGGDGDDVLNGGGQADNLYGGQGDDRLIGEGGFDRLFGGAGADQLRGGNGPDNLFGESGDDDLAGGDADDRLNGGPGNDRIDGGPGDDSLSGGSGFDTILGGPGDDVLAGNFNADTFVFSDGFGRDRIMDFDAANDFEVIDLSSVSWITGWDDLKANHLVQDGSDVLISDGGVDELVLQDQAVEDLSSLDFLF
ncbi:MAG: calcium-binding protein [Pseudomonadota bacterium]